MSESLSLDDVSLDREAVRRRKGSVDVERDAALSRLWRWRDGFEDVEDESGDAHIRRPHLKHEAVYRETLPYDGHGRLRIGIEGESVGTSLERHRAREGEIRDVEHDSRLGVHARCDQDCCRAVGPRVRCRDSRGDRRVVGGDVKVGGGNRRTNKKQASRKNRGREIPPSKTAEANAFGVLHDSLLA